MGERREADGSVVLDSSARFCHQLLMTPMITSQQPQLLATKILPPRHAAGLIDRPRLFRPIDQLHAKQLTVIKAGAGFGKTSLALSWAERLKQAGNLVAWLALDTDDDEPTRFLFYVSQALRRACASVGESAIRLLSDVSLAPLNTIVSTLINDLADVENEMYLFLDDYHCLTHPDIHDAISFLLKHAPAQFHLVLTTREEPLLPLAVLRAQNRLFEIDVSALRFDPDEVRHFLDQENLRTLAPEEVKVLHAKTEGWPAVLRIIASTSSQSTKDFGQYVRGLSGALRPIGAYIAEMLEGLPPDMVQFMLRTAILDRLSAPLCQAVTGVKSSQAMLEAMEARQMLLAPLDGEGRWYRYHALLAGHLSQKLQSDLGDEIPWLHRHAYRWYAAQELCRDAVHHAIAAGDTDQAVAWIKNCAMALVKQGDLLTLLSWQRLFPTELMQSRLDVRLAIAWGMALAMRSEEALTLAAGVEDDVDDTNAPAAEILRSECQAIRSVAIALKDDSQTSLPLALACLERTSDPWTGNVASNVARFGHLKAGDLKSFYATPWIPYSSDDDRRNLFAAVYRRCLQGHAEAQQLRLNAAEHHYLDGMRLAEEHMGPQSIAAALPASLFARIRYEQGRIDESESLVIDRFPLISGAGMLECVLSAYLVLVRVAQWRGNLERAHALLEQAETLGYGRSWGRLVAAALNEQLRLHLAQGRLTESGACLDRLDRLATEYPSTVPCAWSDIRRYAVMARAQLASAQNRPKDSIAILKTLREEVAGRQDHYAALGLSIQLAVALLDADEPTQAMITFREVVSVAAPAGIHQMILDGGPKVGTLLLRVLEHAQHTNSNGELLPYLQDILSSWRERYQKGPRPSSTLGITGLLSGRERNILELIGKGESNKEIARTLDIAPETVKSHVKNIFTKLGVEKRAQAVSRAQSFGLVSTH